MKFDAVWETIAEERELFMFTVSRLYVQVNMYSNQYSTRPNTPPNLTQH